MKKYNNLKIAVVFGKGDDSCGVTRGGQELYLWSKKVGALVDLYAYDKRYSRSGAHTSTVNIIFKNKDIIEITKKINDNYDIVIFMSYPMPKHDHSYCKDFYHIL